MAKFFSRRTFLKASAIAIGAGTLVFGKKLIPWPGKRADGPQSREGRSLSGSKFFNKQEYALVAALASLIVPTDHDPGAAEANVADYIQSLVSRSGPRKKAYAAGLEWIDSYSRKEYGRDFLALDVDQQGELLARVYEEPRTSSGVVRDYRDFAMARLRRTWRELFGAGGGSAFFKTLRDDIFYGYYSNPVSWRLLGYYGPPQPIGYLDFAGPPRAANYALAVRPIEEQSCRNCHEEQMVAAVHPVSHSFLAGGEGDE